MLIAGKKLFSWFSIWWANRMQQVNDRNQTGWVGGTANKMWSLGEQESRGLLTAYSPQVL